MVKMKRLTGRRWGAAAATIALAASLSAFGATSAQAVGSCSSLGSFGGGQGPSSIVATCKGKVKFTWRCSSDLLFRVNAKTVDYGSSWNTRSFVGCNEGYVVDERGFSA